jgi:hypothetical protein
MPRTGPCEAGAAACLGNDMDWGLLDRKRRSSLNMRIGVVHSWKVREGTNTLKGLFPKPQTWLLGFSRFGRAALFDQS